MIEIPSCWQSFPTINMPRNISLIIFLVIVENLVLSIITGSKSTTFSDSCIVYSREGSTRVGIVENIFYIEPQGLNILKIRPLINTHYDSLSIQSETFFNEHIIFGNLSSHETHFISPETIIEKACFYKNDSVCFVARFPNFYESS